MFHLIGSPQQRTMRILPKVVAHKKKATRGGTFTFQMLFQGNEPGSSLLGEDKIL